ncbi:ribonuclease P protein component 1 [Halopenitus sp. H-Gu1]|uniref:ribonuclease P protein component 1 n=1 Tax=Halopenitus sp. H-Gu1 TaxID=3242697 RepID=UPI00359D1F01
MITPETLTRHELIGLPVRVVDASNGDSVTITGRVVDETQRTIVVRTAAGEKRVPKEGTTFEFAIVETPSVAPIADERTDEAAGDRKVPGSTSELGQDTAGVRPCQSRPFPSATSEDVSEGVEGTSRSLGECEDVVYVTVDGRRLLSRPAQRTEEGVSVWR